MFVFVVLMFSYLHSESVVPFQQLVSFAIIISNLSAGISVDKIFVDK